MTPNESQHLDAAIALHNSLRRRGIGPDIHWQAADSDHVMWIKSLVVKGADLDLHWELRLRGLVDDAPAVHNGNEQFVGWLEDTTESVLDILGISECEECDGEGEVECSACSGHGDCGECGRDCRECDGAGMVDCECKLKSRRAAA